MWDVALLKWQISVARLWKAKKHRMLSPERIERNDFILNRVKWRGILFNILARMEEER